MITISTNYIEKFVFKDHPNYIITECKKVINTSRGTIVKKTVNGGSIGWWIASEFIPQSKVNTKVELIKTFNCPF
jgi:hypothetical protein